jgi:hypothetical protein
MYIEGLDSQLQVLQTLADSVDYDDPEPLACANCFNCIPLCTCDKSVEWPIRLVISKLRWVLYGSKNMNVG